LIKADAEGKKVVKVYSDGSAQEGKVGVAAILIRPGKEMRKLHFHLGLTEHHTVFKTELVGLLLGLQLIKTEKAGSTSFALGVDNQATLTVVATPGNRSGHYLVDTFLTTAVGICKSRRSPKYSLMLQWTAGHVDIEGNEQVDKEAKLASEGTTSTKAALLKALRKPLKHNKSAAKQQFRSKLKIRWAKEWRQSPCTARLKHIDPMLPSSKFLKLISDADLSRKGASWLYQLRVGHFPLNAYLHRFKRTESASCPVCGHHTETVQHFLLDCLLYAHERWPLLAGKSSKMKQYANLVGDAKNTIPIIDFIQAMGRFEQESRQRAAGGEEAREDHKRVHPPH
jgi:ribonuclease HI